MILSFILGGKPQPKERARKGAKGRWYTPTKTHRYEQAIGNMALVEVAIAKRNGIAWPVKGKYRVSILAVFPDRRARDIDNVAKSVLDGLNGIAWDDDRQVSEFAIMREYDKSSPRTEVKVTAL